MTERTNAETRAWAEALNMGSGGARASAEFDVLHALMAKCDEVDRLSAENARMSAILDQEDRVDSSGMPLVLEDGSSNLYALPMPLHLRNGWKIVSRGPQIEIADCETGAVITIGASPAWIIDIVAGDDEVQVCSDGEHIGLTCWSSKEEG